eukprot:291418-Pleurochrysis_carterae.AAC.1
MRDAEIRAEWAAFIDINAALFRDRKAEWRNMLANVEQFIEETGGEQRPSFSTHDAYEKRLAQWVWQQQSNYTKEAFIMKDVEIRAEWAAFLAKHDILFGEGSDALRLLLLNFADIMEKLEDFS